MLDVIVCRTVHEPQYRVFATRVQLYGYDRLTPSAARSALEIAFGQPYGGEVWAPFFAYGYRVYAKSTRKIHPDY